MSKQQLFVVGMIVVFGIIVFILNNDNNVVTYEAETATSTVATTTEVLERDVVGEAQAELERINAELDAEETRLLEEIEAIQLEAQSQVDEREQRLEQIRETRVSFQ